MTVVLVTALSSTAFGDGLTLADAYRKALARSEAIQIQRHQQLAAEVDTDATWSQIKPQAFLNATGVIEQDKSVAEPGIPGLVDVFPERYFAGGGQVTQPLFRRGFFDARDASQTGVDAAAAGAARSEEQLMIDVVTVFIAVMESREQVRLAQDAVTRAQTQLAISQARVKAGGSLKTAEQLASIEVDRAKLGTVRAQREADTQAVQFERLVGIEPPAALALPDHADAPALAECLRHATARNDSRALHLLTTQARDREDAIHGRWWPTLDAQAGYSYYSYYFPLGNNVSEWSARLVLTVPLFQGGSEYTELHQQRIRSDVAELEAAERDKSITSEVKTAAIRADASDKAVQITENQAQVALEHYELISAQFKVGAVTFLDVANAEAVLTDAMGQRAATRYDRDLATYQLLFASGLLRL